MGTAYMRFSYQFQPQTSKGGNRRPINNPNLGKSPPQDIWGYASANDFVIPEPRPKTEADMAIHILKQLNDKEKVSSFKIFPLYFIASKSPELMKDKFFWLLLSGITVGNRIITHSSKLRQLCIIAYSVSRLPSLDWVNKQLVEELCVRLKDESIYVQENLNVIDIN